MQPKPEVSERLLSIFLDHFFMVIFSMLFFIPFFVDFFRQLLEVTHEQKDIVFKTPLILIGLTGFSFYFAKDSINGRSIAKRITRLQVVNNATGEVASPLRCVVRNLTAIIWPVEILMTINIPSRRLGDFIAGTRVVRALPAPLETVVKFPKVIAALALSYGFLFSIFLLLSNLNLHFANTSKFVPSSYNAEQSAVLQQSVQDGLREFLRADVRVYDSVVNKKVKYVSVICQLKENYGETNEALLSKIGDSVRSAIYRVVPENTCVGVVKYVYKDENTISVQERSFR